MKTIKTEDMNWPDIKQAIEEGYHTIVIGVGSIEQHGPYLPTKTDTVIGEVIAQKVAEKLDKALIGPTIRFGCSEHHLAFPGTISLKFSTLKALVIDYVDSLVRHDFKNIIFLPSHGGNFKILAEAITELQAKYPEKKIVGYTELYDYVDFISKISTESGITKEESGAHAGENETSLMLAIERDLVITERFEPGYIGEFGEKQGDLIFNKGIKELTNNGVLGDPRKATKENGEIYLEKFVDYLTSKVKEMI
ncbi:MAG: creatininase family protein [Candidatus Heimdallarchaeota archaeon]|nr:creatininase family protein [Candidatus Heimdallarchaeota archaeon]